MFSIADRQAKRLEKLTTEFLSYAKPSVPHRSRVDISDLIGAVESLARIRANGQKIDISSNVDCDATVDLDPTQVEGALLNLTLNAIEATTGNGEVQLTFRMAGNVLRIDVRNSGPGIPDSHLARIFEPFFTTRPNGTGLGLAIARGVAHSHGGDLWVSINEPENVVFTMTLAAFAGKDLYEEQNRGQDSHRR